MSSRFNRLGKVVKRSHAESRGWEMGTYGPASSLAPAGGSPGLSSARWLSPSSSPLLPCMLRHFAWGCLSVFLHSRMLSSISQPPALQPQSARSRIQIFWASAIWTKTPVLPAALHRLEWKKKYKNIPSSWVNAARLPWPGTASCLPWPLSLWAGEQPQPQSCSVAAQPRQSLEKK